MISIVLIEPEHAGNIGAVARVMANFGFEHLIIVNPKEEHLSKDSLDRAVNAKRILHNAKKCDLSILNTFDYVIGTASDLGTDYNLPRSPTLPSQLAKKISSINILNSNIALVFGRETTGLTNKELSLCDFLVSIPTSDTYPSMNLSHAVAIVLYELSNASFQKRMAKKYTPISKNEKKAILNMLENCLSLLDFSTKEKKQTQRILWKKLIGKSMLTKREAFALCGFLRKVIKNNGPIGTFKRN